MDISDCLKQIRAYTAANPELQNAHHFLFDLPVGPELPATCDTVVIGLNPRETDYQRQKWPVTAQMRAAGKIFEESREFDFMHPEGREWTTRIVDFCGTQNVVQTEGFFWSSDHAGRDFFAKCFGLSPKKAVEHLNFCKDMNNHLFKHYRARTIVSAGFKFRDIAIRQYGLTLTNKEMRRHPEYRDHSLVEEYTDGLRRWVFTVHWTNGRGLTGPRTAPATSTLLQSGNEDERAVIRSYIRRTIALPPVSVP